MKSHDVVGYCVDSSIFCEDCGRDYENDGDVIFASSEWDYQPYCEECDEKLAVNVIK